MRSPDGGPASGHGPRPRLGLVSFLNARPIAYGLLDGRQRGRFAVVEMLPSALADALASGQLDLALIPSVEYARSVNAGRELAIVPGIAIASRAAADSVLLFSRVPLAEVRSIALDVASRTSVLLLRLLLRRRLRPGAPDPAWTVGPADLPAMLERAEAALVIGDRALLASREHPGLTARLSVYDLGREWRAMTDLPFVFAFLAGPPPAVALDHIAALQDSLREGLANLDAIARFHGGDDPALADLIHRYLSRSIDYDLDAAALKGLRAFYSLLIEERLLDPPVPELTFLPDPGTSV